MEIEHFSDRLSRKYLTFFWVILPTFLVSSAAHAHVKWFVETEDQFKDVYFQSDWISGALILGAVFYLAIALGAYNKAKNSDFIAQILYKPTLPSTVVPVLLRLAAATFLLGNILQDNFVAPNFTAGDLSSMERLLQGSLLVLLVANARLFSIGLIVFSLSLFIYHPFSNAIDYAPELLALAIAIYIYPSNRVENTANKLSFIKGGTAISREALAVTAVRVGLGIQLIILTIHDKLIDPGLALNFLSGYPYINFMSVLFPSFTDLHFILAAGLAELCFGLLLITNISTRLSTFCILFFFSLSGVILGPHELVGHIPIVILAIIVFSVPGADTEIKITGLSTPLFNNAFSGDIVRALRNQIAR